MKIAACVLPDITDVLQALHEVIVFIEAASKEGCELIVFPEAAIGSIDLCGYYKDDVELGVKHNGKVLREIQNTAKRCHIAVGIGFLESYIGTLYDSYMLINKQGDPFLHYRRISPGWKASEYDNKIYCCGTEVMFADTEWGKVSVLLCGDLFDAGVREKLIGKDLRFIVHPMARSFTYSEDVQDKWDKEEFPWYMTEYNKLQVPVLVVNCVESPLGKEYYYCGGAWWIQEQRVHKTKRLGEPGLLLIDV